MRLIVNLLKGAWATILIVVGPILLIAYLLVAYSSIKALVNPVAADNADNIILSGFPFLIASVIIALSIRYYFKNRTKRIVETR